VVAASGSGSKAYVHSETNLEENANDVKAEVNVPFVSSKGVRGSHLVISIVIASEAKQSRNRV